MKPGSVVIVSSGDTFIPGIVIEIGDRIIEVCLQGERRVNFSPRKITLEIDLELSEYLSSGVRERFFKEVGSISGEIDLGEVWEFVMSEGSANLQIEDAASLAGFDVSAPVISSIVLNVLADPVYFKLKDRLMVPYGREAVENLLRRRRNEASRAEALEKGCSCLRIYASNSIGALNFDGFCARMPEEAARLIRAVRETALKGDSSPSAGLARETLDALGRDPGRSLWLACFRLMVTFGFWGTDIDLSVESLGLSPEFSSDVMAAADSFGQVFIGDAACGRMDFTNLTVISVDDESTTDIDDAFGFQFQDDGTMILHVFIADPSEFLRRGPLFEEGRRRGATLYLPTGKFPMLPPVISEDLASLKEGTDRLALLFSIPVGMDGTCGSLSVSRAVVKVSRRISYEEADAALSGFGVAASSGRKMEVPSLPFEVQHSLEEGSRLAGILKNLRAAGGAVLLSRREVLVKVSDGRVAVRPLDGNSPSRLMIQEMMILVNAMTAAYCSERGIDAVYRRQDLPDGMPSSAVEIMAKGHEITDPFLADTILKGMRKAVMSTHPESHSSLGVGAYTQVTSPLRRFQDLVMHMQLKSHLDGTGAFDKEDLMAMFSELEEISSGYSKIERDSKRYWIIRSLAEKMESGPVVLEGFVTDFRSGRAEVTLPDFDVRVKIPASNGIEKGQVRGLRVQKAVAREDLLLLEPVS